MGKQWIVNVSVERSGPYITQCTDNCDSGHWVLGPSAQVRKEAGKVHPAISVIGETILVSLTSSFMSAVIMLPLGGSNVPLAVNCSELFLTIVCSAYVVWVYKRDSLGSIWWWGKPSVVATIGTICVIGAGMAGRGSNLKSIFPAVQMVFRPQESVRLALCVFAPFREEVFYRGCLLRRLAPIVGTWPAIAISSVIFGLVHPNPLGAMAIGAAYGWLYSPGGAGNLYAPMLFHALVNLTAGVPSYFR